MKNREIIQALRAEAEEHTPDVAVDVANISLPEGHEIALPNRHHRVALFAALAAFVLLLVAILLVVFLRSGGTELSTLVISINPTAEFTLEDGKVIRTRPLNRDAAVLIAGSDFNGKTAEEACLAFADLAEKKHLIGTGGVSIRVTGKNGSRIEQDVKYALDKLFSVNELDEDTLQSLLGSYDEDAMDRFEEYVEHEYTGKKEEYLSKATELLQSYREDLLSLDLQDEAARAQFNKKYLLLGEDLIFGENEREDTFEEQREEMLEEFEEIEELQRENPSELFEELFEEFLELFEKEYDDD